MNKENAHLFLPFVHALANGKTLQWKDEEQGPECWNDLNEIEFLMHDDPSCFRIKPEPRSYKIYAHKYSNQFSNQHYNNPDWELITVQEVLK